MITLSNNKHKILKRILWGLLIASPLVSVYLLCAVQGGNLFEVYLPNANNLLWNDEAFYYKQIEAMVHFGIPQGFFGYNETHAHHLTFGTWSPFLLAPYMVFGWIFGWTFSSPVIANILFVTISFGILVFVLRPTTSSSLFLILFNILYTAGSRHIVSGMTEALCFSFAIVLTVLLLYMIKEKASVVYVVFFIVISMYAILMRPYFLIFPIVFAVYGFIEKKRILSVVTIISGIVAILVYFVQTNYLSAPYLVNMIRIDNYLYFLREATVFHFFEYLFKNLGLGYEAISGRIVNILNGDFYSVIFALYLTVIVLCIVRLCVSIKNKNKKYIYCFSSILFILIAVMFALILLYEVFLGGRHMLTFVYVAVIALSFGKFKLDKVLLLALMFMLTFIFKSDGNFYSIPMKNHFDVTVLQEVEQILEREMPPAGVTHDRFESTIAMVAVDKNIQDENHIMYAKWQDIYYFPKGYGINYVQDPTGVFRSKFIYTIKGGKMEQAILEHGKKEDLIVAEWEGRVMYINPLFEPTVF